MSSTCTWWYLMDTILWPWLIFHRHVKLLLRWHMNSFHHAGLGTFVHVAPWLSPGRIDVMNDWVPSGYVEIAIEHYHFYRVFPIKTLTFHSYLKLQRVHGFVWNSRSPQIPLKLFLVFPITRLDASGGNTSFSDTPTCHIKLVIHPMIS